MDASNFELFCEYCFSKMIPIYFTEEEYHTEHGRLSKTGRKRRNVSHFECQICGHKEVVDDSFAGKWY